MTSKKSESLSGRELAASYVKALLRLGRDSKKPTQKMNLQKSNPRQKQPGSYEDELGDKEE